MLSVYRTSSDPDPCTPAKPAQLKDKRRTNKSRKRSREEKTTKKRQQTTSVCSRLDGLEYQCRALLRPSWRGGRHNASMLKSQMQLLPPDRMLGSGTMAQRSCIDELIGGSTLWALRTSGIRDRFERETALQHDDWTVLVGARATHPGLSHLGRACAACTSSVHGQTVGLGGQISISIFLVSANAGQPHGVVQQCNPPGANQKTTITAVCW